jgi:hypothetical protein
MWSNVKSAIYDLTGLKIYVAANLTCTDEQQVVGNAATPQR